MDQRETCAVIALNVLSGNVHPKQWKGFRRVDEEEEAVLKLFNEVRRWGFGKLEVDIAYHRLETAYPRPTFKRKDLLK
mgnify:FL=1